MKCGIITFHRAVNFGAILQTYALNKKINSIGTECEVIDYHCGFLEKHYEPFNIKKILNLKKIAITILINGNIKDNRKNFLEFSEKYLKLSKKTYYTKEDLINCNNEYDTFITGSDQVWSYYCAGFDKAYFLDFVEKDTKKNSYAASFGVSDIPNEFISQYKRLLGDFNNISVREKQGAKIVENILERKVKVVLDPTLLLDKKEWEKISIGYKRVKKYILVYLLAETKSILKFAKELAKKEELEIIYINDRVFKRRGMTNLDKISPNEWLNLFLNAEYIVTNSFHGICFSINFNKQFFMEYLQGNAKVNSRLENILKMFKLNNRCIENGNVLCENKIDYKIVNEILEYQRNESIQFLENIINNTI